MNCPAVVTRSRAAIGTTLLLRPFRTRFSACTHLVLHTYDVRLQVSFFLAEWDSHFIVLVACCDTTGHKVMWQALCPAKWPLACTLFVTVTVAAHFPVSSASINVIVNQRGKGVFKRSISICCGGRALCCRPSLSG